MKKIEFIEQGLENFCSHIDPVVINFGNGSITMITGPNGIGKTSIFQSIPFTLYGQCEKGRGDDVLNNKTGKNCHTWTIFKINDVKYRVDRYVKYTRLGNSVTITKGDSNKPYLKGHKEVVPEIEKLLMPYKLFMNTLLFSQKVKSFFTDLGDSDQKEIFRKIMTLDDFVLYMKQCGIELKNIESTILELNQKIAVNEGLLDSETKQLELLNEKRILFKSNKLTKINDLNQRAKGIDLDILEHLKNQKNLPEDTLIKRQELTNKCSVLEHKLSNLDSEESSKINNLNSQKSLKISELQNKGLELSNLKSKELNDAIEVEKKNLDKKGTLIQTKMLKIGKENEELNTKKTQLNSTITFIENENETLRLDSKLNFCPTCKRDMNKDCVDHINSMIEINNNEKLKTEEKIKELDIIIQKNISINKEFLEENINNLNLYNEKVKKLQDENNILIQDFEKRKDIAVGKVNKMFDEAVIEIKRINIEEKKKLKLEVSDIITELNELKKIQEEIDLYNNKLIEFQKQKDMIIESLRLENEQEFDDSLIKKCESKLQEYINIINKTLKERNVFDEQITMIKFWKTGFSASGIQSMLIDEAIPFMNERISYYMEKLCNGRYKVTFDTLKATKDNKEFRDKISVNVFDTQTHSDKRVKFSGGQTRLVDIGTILTLADLMANVQDTSVNIILFDEIFDSLDSENIKHASNLLRIAARDKWVGIISHTKIDDIEADNLLEFR